MSVFTFSYRILMLSMMFFLIVSVHYCKNEIINNQEILATKHSVAMKNTIAQQTETITQNDTAIYKHQEKSLADIDRKLRFLNTQFVSIAIHTKLTQEECRGKR